VLGAGALTAHAQEREALARELAAERSKQHNLWRDRERLQVRAPGVHISLSLFLSLYVEPQLKAYSKHSITGAHTRL